MGNKPKKPLNLSSDPEKGADGIFIKGFVRIETGRNDWPSYKSALLISLPAYAINIIHVVQFFSFFTLKGNCAYFDMKKG